MPPTSGSHPGWTGSSGRREAQARADRIRAFRDELAWIEDEGIVDLPADQSRRIHAYHESVLADLSRRFDVDTTDAAKQMSWGLRLASILGALALCACVWFLFHRLWGSLSTPMQVVVPAAATLLAIVATELIGRLERSGYLAGLAALIALGCFVLNVQVIGNVFNMTPDENALLAWGAFALIFAYAYSLRALLACGIVLVMAFAVAKAGSLQGLIWYVPFWRLPEYSMIAGFLTFLAPLALRHRRLDSFPPVYRLAGGMVALVAIMVLGLWGESSCLEHFARDAIEEAYQTLGLVLAGAGVGIGMWRRWSETASLGGAAFFVFLYVKFFDWWWDWLPKWLFFLIFGLCAVGALLLILPFRRRLARSR